MRRFLPRSEDLSSLQHGCVGFFQLPKVLMSARTFCVGFRPCPKAWVFASAMCSLPPLSEDAGFRSHGCVGFLQLPKVLVSAIAVVPASPLVRGREVPPALVCRLSPLSEDAGFQLHGVVWSFTGARGRRFPSAQGCAGSADAGCAFFRPCPRTRVSVGALCRFLPRSEDLSSLQHGFARVFSSSRRCCFPSARVAFSSVGARRRRFPIARCTGFRLCPKARVSTCAGCLALTLAEAGAG
jgi:hypothetical protein